MRQIAFPGLLVLALVLPSAASAANVNCQAPAGTSGIDQYCEVLPGAGGNGTTGHHKKKHVSSQTTQTLQKQGSAGQAILALTEASGSATGETTAPATTSTPAKHKAHHKKQSSSTATPTTTSTGTQTPTKTTTQAKSEGPSPSNDPFSAVGNSFSVGSGVGGSFVWVLVGIGLVLVAMAWLQYRTRNREAGPGEPAS
jgi:cobalamin biosynthesis Mg chelatase CobN